MGMGVLSGWLVIVGLEYVLTCICAYVLTCLGVLL